MSKQTKKQKNYIYNGLGFPIVLEEAEFKKIKNQWVLKINVEEVADEAIRLLPTKSTGLTGAEIRFIRTYFELSKRKFAEELNVSHTAVNKWESFDQERAKIDSHVEVMLRALVMLKLNEESDFSNFFRGLIDESKKFSDDKKSRPIAVAG